MLTAKRGKSSSWLPTQVAYGIDCSSDDPSKWQPFGEIHEQKQAEEAKKALASGPKVPTTST